MIGQTLAHYRITAALGAGGMGEVYRATDNKLNREVAIKVLPPEVARDPERLARFQREAQLLAALNHPNVAAIYGLEEAGGKPFLALELVEGEDLKQRLEKGGLPVDEALEVARQIAEALEEAHARGIVHRDLKPANVKVTPDGRVKVLDFGLAKAWGGDAEAGGSSLDLSQSPTLARTGTLAGVILGTAAYMSPEQAAGKAVDKRADIWSFGVVLFEMLTGTALFTGETASEIMASVIKEEPDWASLPATCPPAVRKLLRRCLRKKPRERLQDIGDGRLELEEVLSGPTDDADEGPEVQAAAREEARRGRTRERWAWAAVALVLAGLVAVLAWRGDDAEGRPALRAEVRLPANLTLGQGERATISPDGRYLAYAASAAGSPQLWVQSLETAESRAVPGTEGAAWPFWSPDGGRVAFAAQGRLQAASVPSGVVRDIGPLPGPRFGGGDWREDGLIVVSSAPAGDPWGTGYSISTLQEEGDDPEPLTTLDAARGETRHIWPQFVPGEDGVLITVTSEDPSRDGFYVVPLDEPSARRRVDLPWGGAQRVTLAPAGDRLFVLHQDGGTLFAEPYGGEPGEPTPLATNVSPGFPLLHVSASDNGTLLYAASAGPRDVHLTWFDRSGARGGTLGEPGLYGQLTLSPDGSRIAASRQDGGEQIWIIDVARGLADRATYDGGNNPVWSPDGREIVFGRRCETRSCLYRLSLAEGASPTLVVESDLPVYPESWTEHGDTLVYLEGPLENRAVRVLSMASGGEPETLLQTGFALDEPQVSPDGRWLAYLTDDSGEMEVYIRPFRRSGERVRVSARGGGQPKWRADGRELFYVSGDGTMMTVEVEARGETVELGRPTALFPVGTVDPLMDSYAPSLDGQRFLVAMPESEETVVPHQLIVNWPALIE